ncbi:MAG: nucleoside 2-deoxyribosyltransferase [Candidatus Curtissbacteria bacterium]|nr:nucleoside 2-deoxyribosyltransferase [Candidatus Curtissbacteria bacterium]
MKIYFAAAVTGGRDYEDYNKDIAKILTGLGHNILSEHVVGFELQKVFRKKAEASGNFSKYISSHNKKLMDRADVIVAECSQGSLGTGFEICYCAYVRKIPAICLRHEKAPGKASSTIFGDSSRLIKSYFYNDKNLEEVLTKAIGKIKG